MSDRNAAALLESACRAFPLLLRVATRGVLVGGAVRDLILGREPRDADIAIARAAEEATRFAKECRGKVIALGTAPFDVVRVAAQGVVYDFAELVGASIEEDLSRRDFTIGAIALPLGDGRGLVDPFDGAGDLGRGVLRMVKESNFADDPLRVLRGARLVAELGLSIDDATLEAMRRHAGDVARCAPERIGVEWLALLAADDANALRRGLELLRELEVDRIVVGGALDEAAISRAVGTGGADAVTRLAAITLGSDEAAVGDISLRLGLGATRIDAMRRALRLVAHLIDERQHADDPVVLHDAGRDAAMRAVAIVRALGRVELAGSVEARIASDGERIFDAKPMLDGRAIIALTGLAPGPRVGLVRRALLEAQLRSEVRDDDEARAFVREKSAES